MFSINHFIWLFISIAIIAVSLFFLKKKHPALKSVFTVACIVSAVSEVIKLFSMIELVPTADGSAVYPYIEMEFLPVHLCSIQILFIFLVRFWQNSPKKETLLAFMYSTCFLGALLALFIPSIFTSGNIDVSQAFTHPLPYQYFLYHAMLIILALYIPMSGEVNIRAKHYFSTVAILFGLVIGALYLNSVFASPVYENGVLVSVEYVTNFFFMYSPPINIALTEKWQWMLYVGIIFVLGLIGIALTYIPYFNKALKSRKTQKDAKTQV